VVAPESRAFGRPGNGQALNRAYQYLDLVPNWRTRFSWINQIPLTGVRGSVGPIRCRAGTVRAKQFLNWTVVRRRTLSAPN
jgi:hypothetical protein